MKSSEKIIKRAKTRFKELEHKNYDWKSFYTGFLEAESQNISNELEVVKALKAIVDNIENWIETNEPADSETSELLYNNAKKSLEKYNS